MAKAKEAEAKQDEGASAPSVPCVRFGDLSIPLDALFVTSSDRSVASGGKEFMFKAGVPRQLPANHIVKCLGEGVQVAV